MRDASISPLPNVLDNDLSRSSVLDRVLARWGGVSMSPPSLSPKLVSPYHARLERNLTTFQKAGLRYERNVFRALARGDFTENLHYLIANNSHSRFDLSDKFFPNYLIIYNPNILYFKNKKMKLSIPDILIIFDSPANLSQIANNFKNLSPANLSFLSPANQNSTSPANQSPANQTSPANQNFIICIEVKLTYVEGAIFKLKNTYLPIVAKLFNLPIIPLIIVKNLTKTSPPSETSLAKALELNIPLLNYLGNRNDILI